MEFFSIVDHLFIDLGNLVIVIFKYVSGPASSGILTLVTGSIAYWVYYQEQKSRKKDAATIILQDIRRAENVIKDIKTSGFDVQNELITLLPDRNWGKYSHVLVRSLTGDEFELVSNFFNGCEAAQSELNQWRKYYIVNREAKAQAMQATLVRFAEEYAKETDEKKKEENYKKYTEQIVVVTNKEEYLFQPSKPVNYFMKYLDSIPQISGTTAAKKIASIAAN